MGNLVLGVTFHRPLGHTIVVAELDLDDLLGKVLNDGSDLVRRNITLWNVGDYLRRLPGTDHQSDRE
jgi:hypothetical protein